MLASEQAAPFPTLGARYSIDTYRSAWQPHIIGDHIAIHCRVDALAAGSAVRKNPMKHRVVSLFVRLAHNRPIPRVSLCILLTN